MSLMEVRLMTALVVKHKCTLQSSDFKQAFFQSTLPFSETYALNPPLGCPLTPKHTYWLLKRSLYGLKRAPKHSFGKAKTILNKIGLTLCPKHTLYLLGHTHQKQSTHVSRAICRLLHFLL